MQSTGEPHAHSDDDRRGVENHVNLEGMFKSIVESQVLTDLGIHILRVVSRVGGRDASLCLDGFCAQLVEELAVVAHNHHGNLLLLQVLLQPLNGVQVQAGVQERSETWGSTLVWRVGWA